MSGRHHGRLLVLLCILTEALCASRVNVNSALQYDDLLLSADEGYFAGAQTIEQLKNFLGTFSTYLAEAAGPVGRQLSFGIVRLLVPRSRVDVLKAAGYEFTQATWESEANADVRISSSDSSVGSVDHSGECQDPGVLMKMPGFLMKANSAGKVYLTRLFAQYRWGVLPDSDKNSGKFYFNGWDFQPFRCSQAIPGKFQSVSGGPLYDTIGPCIVEHETTKNLQLTAECQFIPNDFSSNIYANIMADYGIKSYVKRFCEGEGSSDLVQHDPMAPTLQNQKCRLRSAKEVAVQHADFSATGTAPSVASAPTLLLIEPPPNRKIVLVLDISGSMLGNRIRNLITAATRYVEYFLETGAEVAVVSFNDSVFYLQPLTPLTSLSVRQAVSDVIRRLLAAGWTNIGGGMLKAMEILGATAPYNKSQTGNVVLITDGQSNYGPNLTDTITSAAKTSIVFDTVCISSEADARMTRLAKDTGGWAMFSSSNTSIPLTTELDAAFSKMSERSPSGNRSILLYAKTFSLPMIPMSLKVDDTVTTSLNFMLSIPTVNIATLNVTVKDPNGKVFGSFMGSSVYEVNSALSSILIKIPDVSIVVGAWTVYVQDNTVFRRRRDAQVDEFLQLIRTPRATSVDGSVVVIGGTTNSSVSLVTCWLRYSSIPQVTASTVQKIYASVSSATGTQITGATIQASVGSPTGFVILVSLMDDGLGFDSVTNDGIYSGAILPDQLTSVGDYSVSVSVFAPINRVTSAGKFRVDALASGPVTLPPGVVTDMLVSMSVKLQMVQVQFTAPGNQAYFGTAGTHEIRASNSFALVSQNFSNTPIVATLPGQLAGSKVQATLWASNFTDVNINRNRTIYIATATVSSSGIRGDPSFPMGALLVYPASYIPPVPAAPNPTTYIPPMPAVSNPTADRPTSGAPPGPQTTPREPTTTTDPVEGADLKWTAGVIAGVAVMSTVILAEGIAIFVILYVLR